MREDSGIYYKREVYPSMDSAILRGETAELLMKERGESFKPPQSLSQPTPISAPSTSLVKRIYLRAEVPWDKLSDLIKGVISPLKSKGKPPSITIEIAADSGEGFDRTTLDSKVKETLRQIDAKIEIWKEE